jgi:signal peptidase I
VAVEGGSMEPALQAGDFLVAVRTGLIQREALVVMEQPDRPGFELVKRVEALPGERVADRVLGPDEYWVTGDRLDASTDSRTFGPVSRDSILGVVKARYWPPSRWGFLGP